MRTLLLFPGALGDLICLLPSIGILRSQSTRLAVVAREWLFDILPAGVELISMDRAEISGLWSRGPVPEATRAVLQGFDRVESWTGHEEPGFSERLTEASGGVSRVHPFRGMEPGEHAIDYYARCVGVESAAVAIEIRPTARARAEALLSAAGRRGLVVHPGSGSRRKNWEGMRSIAEAWRADGNPVVLMRGPAETDNLQTFPCDVRVDREPLSVAVAALENVGFYLGNDSGITHLAASVGCRGVALFAADGEPEHWAPRGRIRTLQVHQRCRSCGADRFCTHVLPIADVWSALTRERIA